MSSSSADIKAALKEAREALKNKDFAVAQKNCKTVLALDPDHFMGLVLMGASLQESDPQMAATHLRRAVKTPNTNLAVALQGLSLCADPSEMPDICRQLLEQTPDRYADLFAKLVKASADVRQMASAVAPFVAILQTEVQSEDTSPERRDLARFYLARLYITNNGCAANAEWLPMFFEAMRYAAENPCAVSAEKYHPNKATTVHAVIYKTYLQMLYVKGPEQHSTLLQNACKMLELYPTEHYPMECVCNVFVSRYGNSDGFRLEEYLSQPIGDYARGLLKVMPQSTVGLMANAIVAFNEGHYVHARQLLVSLLKLESNWDECLKWLALTHQKLGAWAIAEALLRKLSINDITLAECMVLQPECPEKLIEAIVLCRDLLVTAAPEDKAQIYFVLAKGLIESEQFDEIEQIISRLTDLGAAQLANHVQSLLHIHQNNAAKAIELLSNADSCELLLLLGRAHLQQAQYAAALSNFLAATKLEPYNSDCFYWLARVYQSNGSTGVPRAIKCLEKCLLLNERHEAATTLLVGLHMESQAHDAIEKLLTVTVADPIAGIVVPCKWVWLLLGTHRQRAGRYNDAVTAFRVALRDQPTNVRSWIGLADTYRERGSLSSALKVYQKCLEMKANRPDAADISDADDAEYLHALLQVASLKSSLGLYSEAVESFDVLLLDRPDFVPALKGLAESHMGLAQGFGEQKLFGRARQHAANAVTSLTKALRHRNDFACLWRLLASALTFVANLSDVHAHLDVAAELHNQPDTSATGTVKLLGPQLYGLASSCLSRALKIRPDDVLLWYELSLNYYQRATKHCAFETSATTATRLQHLERAAAAARYTVQLQPSRWQNWNLLGVICATEEIDNAALAQHAFIKAVQLNRTAAPAWTNLGVLYASRAGDVRLANRAFGQAQQAQTDYVYGWTGQACLAEQLGQPCEAIDLFQHATRLQYTGESALGFVHWVCMALSLRDDAEPHMRYVCDRMFGPTEALDSIEWYLRAEDAVSVSIWCFAGYLYYGRSMWPQAVRAFERAVQLADADNALIRDKMLFNLGTSLLRADRAEEAQRVFHSVTEATFDTAIGLAVAHQQAGQFEDAYGVYESALQLLAQTDAQRSQTLVAMSAIVYKFQGEQDAKSLLFQCIGLPEPPVEGLFSGCAVGIIHQDMQLSELVLNELQKHKHDPRYMHHIAFLTAQFHRKNNRPKKGLMYLLSQVHVHPDHLELRKVLANFIMQNAQRSESQLTAASRVAESTIVLQLSNAKSNDSSEQGAKSLAMASEAMRCVDQNRRKMLAQRAVHVNPTCRQAWAALLMCAQ